jgi:hypothetical protein
MKKFMIMLLALSCFQVMGLMQPVYADDTAKIKIKISGAVRDNRYFLCLPNIGCLSILAATTKGRIYPIIHAIEMDNMFVADMNDSSIHRQGLPPSCNVTVKTNQTITIYGNITKGRNESIHVNRLRCSVS